MTIGEGSFSSVYRARQKILDRWVAVKILHEKDGARRIELLNEARNQARMSLPCIPTVYDAFIRGQQLFIVMEWVKGASLQSLLEAGIPEQTDRRALCASIIAALAGLHKLGFAHRDIKPANILVTPESGVYLVDFGFSRQAGEGGQSIVGVVKGTPAYMAPEVWQGGGNVDFMKSDLFALGKVLQELEPGSEWESLIRPLLSHRPDDRPVSAVELWESARLIPAARTTPDWKAAIVHLSSGLLSQRLLQAAKQLLFARRREEAYWLLAECLQEDPDSVEALRLIDSFPDLSKEKKRKRWIAALAACLLFLVALTAAFHFGRRAGQDIRIAVGGSGAGSRQLLLPSHTQGNGASRARASALGPVRFTELRGGGNRLSGILFVEGAELCGRVRLDARDLADMNPSRRGKEGLPLEPGEHFLDCADSLGNPVHREKFGLLPFQRKTVRLRSASAAKDG
jgi:predicted Ser/Thr protein kinase